MCDACKGTSANSIDSSDSDYDDGEKDGIRKKVSRISLGEKDDEQPPWCTKCKSNILKLEDTMPGISTIIPTFNLNSAIGRIVIFLSVPLGGGKIIINFHFIFIIIFVFSTTFYILFQTDVLEIHVLIKTGYVVHDVQKRRSIIWP